MKSGYTIGFWEGIVAQSPTRTCTFLKERDAAIG